MTQRKPIRTNRPPLKPAVAGATAPAAAGELPALIWVSLGALAIFVVIIVLAFTPYTYLLDEIKVTLFFTMGPLLMLLACLAMFLKQAPVPSRSIWIGTLAYMAIVAISTFMARYPWIGKFYIIFTWAQLGFMLTAFIVAVRGRGGIYMVRFMVALLAMEIAIGFFLYDVTSSPQHHSGIAILKYLLYGAGQPANPDPFYYLIDTLVRADDTLQSTILNRDFFAGFCCLLVPFAYLLSFHPGPPSLYNPLWRIIGIVTSVLGSLTIFLCQSKGEWFVWIFALAFFIAMCFKIGFFHLSDLKRGHLLAWIIGAMVLLGAVAWMKSPTLLFQLKSTGASLESREIIWGGAVRIWKDDLPQDLRQGTLHNMIFGSGPGTFRIYFSAVRRPDYYLHGINNVTTLSHNYFLDVLSETGLLGMIAFGTLLAGLFGLGMRHAFKKDNDLFTRLALAASITGLMSIFGSNMTSPSARWVICATPMWVAMGVLAGFIYQAQRGPFTAPAPAGAPGQPAPTPLDEAMKLAPLGLLILSLPMAVWGYASGVRYFDSLRRYAIGLSYLETGSGMLKTESNPDTLILYFNESIKYFKDSLQVDETNTSAYYKIGSAYTSLSQIYSQMSETLASQGKTAEAARFMEQADDNLVHAKESYENLMKYDPDYAEIHYNMGIIYQLYAAMIKRGIANGLKHPEFTPEKAREYEQKALLHLEKMEKVSIKPEVATMLGNQYMSMGRFDKARDVYRDASHRSSADETIIQNYHNNALKANDMRGACDALELLWTRKPGRNDWLEQLVQLAHQNNYNDVLEKVVERLDHVNPIHPKLFEAKAYLALSKGNPIEAAGDVNQYLRSGGQDPAVIKLGADAAEKAGKPELAAALYRSVAEGDREGKTAAGQAAAKWLKDHGAAPGAGGAAKAAPAAATQGASKATTGTAGAAAGAAKTSSTQANQ